jgi:ABC-2 type transport system ATP-binding protein
VIAVENLTKRYGETLAVDDLSFRVEPGHVTGFLGPNGAGKTTTLRILLDLVAATSGAATIDGSRYRDLEQPARRVGSVLEATNFHPGRKGRNHLRVRARPQAIPDSRVDELLDLVDLTGPANKRVKTYSLGMRQRLTIAGALLGDPDVLLLDEPANGLDPEGIRWLRGFLRGLAEQGRTVFVSSHVLSEMTQLADHVVIIHRGRLISDTPLAEILTRAEGGVRVRSPDAGRFREVLTAAGIEATESDGMLAVKDTPIERVGELAAENRIVLHELSPVSASLEEVFLQLTGDGQ